MVFTDLDFLNSLLVTLNGISVAGKDNMDHLLGCIIAIEGKIMALTAENEMNEKDGEVADG